MLLLFFIVVGGFLAVQFLSMRRDVKTQHLARQSSARSHVEQQLQGNALKTYIHRLADFRFTHCLLGRDYRTAVALDETTGQLCLIDATTPNIYHRFYAGSDLLGVSLTEDGNVLAVPPGSSPVARTLVGMLVGDLLLGPVGALLGSFWGASANAAPVPSASSLELQLNLNDTRTPLWRVRFLVESTRKDSPAYLKARETALQWQALLEVVMRRSAGTAAVVKYQEIPSATPRSRIDVLKRPGSTLPVAPAAPGTEVTAYAVRRAGKEVGVMPAPRIRSLLLAGHLNTRDQYFDPQLQDWLTLDLLPEERT